VHGTVTGYGTGQPVANDKLMVVQNPGSLYSMVQYDTITTKSDGTYNYSFTPSGTGSLIINVINGSTYADDNTQPPLTIGNDTKVDVQVQQMVKLSLHLVNKSTYNLATGTVIIEGCCYIPNHDYYYLRGIGAKKIDTMLYTPMPKSTTVTIRTVLTNSYESDPNAVVFKQSFTSGKNDTTITIINP
jgi:hypothetical protein